MNERARWPVVVFAACALGAAVALSLVSVHALRLERREMEARARAAAEESARLALWRMDSALAPVIAREAGRPYFHWSAFYPAGRAYTTMWEEVRPGEVLVASPLLTFSDPLVRLHFQLSPEGRLTSPQAPTGNMRDLVESAYMPPRRVMEAEERLAALRAVLGEPAETFAAACSPLPPPGAPAGAADGGGQSVWQNLQQSGPLQQQEQLLEIAQNEYAARQNIARMGQRAGAAPAGETPQIAAGAPVRDSGPVAASEEQVECGDLTPVWRAGEAGPELLLLRTVRAGGTVTVQGVWLDWPGVRGWLLGLIGDVAPGADLRPLEDAAGWGTAPVAPVQGAERWLAAIPAVLELGGGGAAVMPVWTPMRTTLALSWLAVLGAAVISAMVLRAARELADRRGRFVSAVTHELRTPMTTFRLYTQMLADGMVADEPARREYLGTLRREADRLAGIVETVLEFARLGRRGKGAPARPVPLAEVLDGLVPALRDRAAASGMTLAVDGSAAGAAGVRVVADPQALGQILHNLVENACKYAGPAVGGASEVTLSVRRAGQRVAITLSDGGPGVDPSVRRRLFRPFQRSASLDHAGVPGLGLGLALSRGLARRMRGDLRLTASSARGSEFTLTVPVVGE